MACCNLSGSLLYSVDNVENLLKRPHFSKSKVIDNILWQIKVATSTDEDGERYVGFFVMCDLSKIGLPWPADWTVKATVIFSVGQTVKLLKSQFDQDGEAKGFSKFLSWKDFLDPARGFVESQKAVFKIGVCGDFAMTITSQDECQLSPEIKNMETKFLPLARHELQHDKRSPLDKLNNTGQPSLLPSQDRGTQKCEKPEEQLRAVMKDLDQEFKMLTDIGMESHPIVRHCRLRDTKKVELIYLYNPDLTINKEKNLYDQWERAVKTIDNGLLSIQEDSEEASRTCDHDLFLKLTHLGNELKEIKQSFLKLLQGQDYVEDSANVEGNPDQLPGYNEMLLATEFGAKKLFDVFSDFVAINGKKLTFDDLNNKEDIMSKRNDWAGLGATIKYCFLELIKSFDPEFTTLGISIFRNTVFKHYQGKKSDIQAIYEMSDMEYARYMTKYSGQPLFAFHLISFFQALICAFQNSFSHSTEQENILKCATRPYFQLRYLFPPENKKQCYYWRVMSAPWGCANIVIFMAHIVVLSMENVGRALASCWNFQYQFLPAIESLKSPVNLVKKWQEVLSVVCDASSQQVLKDAVIVAEHTCWHCHLKVPAIKAGMHLMLMERAQENLTKRITFDEAQGAWGIRMVCHRHKCWFYTFGQMFREVHIIHSLLKHAIYEQDDTKDIALNRDMITQATVDKICEVWAGNPYIYIRHQLIRRLTKMGLNLKLEKFFKTKFEDQPLVLRDLTSRKDNVTANLDYVNNLLLHKDGELECDNHEKVWEGKVRPFYDQMGATMSVSTYNSAEIQIVQCPSLDLNKKHFRPVFGLNKQLFPDPNPNQLNYICKEGCQRNHLISDTPTVVPIHLYDISTDFLRSKCAKHLIQGDISRTFRIPDVATNRCGQTTKLTFRMSQRGIKRARKRNSPYYGDTDSEDEPDPEVNACKADPEYRGRCYLCFFSVDFCHEEIEGFIAIKNDKGVWCAFTPYEKHALWDETFYRGVDSLRDKKVLRSCIPVPNNWPKNIDGTLTLQQLICIERFRLHLHWLSQLYRSPIPAFFRLYDIDGRSPIKELLPYLGLLKELKWRGKMVILNSFDWFGAPFYVDKVLGYTISQKKMKDMNLHSDNLISAQDAMWGALSAGIKCIIISKDMKKAILSIVEREVASGGKNPDRFILEVPILPPGICAFGRPYKEDTYCCIAFVYKEDEPEQNYEESYKNFNDRYAFLKKRPLYILLLEALDSLSSMVVVSRLPEEIHKKVYREVTINMKYTCSDFKLPKETSERVTLTWCLDPFPAVNNTTSCLILAMQTKEWIEVNGYECTEKVIWKGNVEIFQLRSRSAEKAANRHKKDTICSLKEWPMLGNDFMPTVTVSQMTQNLHRVMHGAMTSCDKSPKRESYVCRGTISGHLPSPDFTLFSDPKATLMLFNVGKKILHNHITKLKKFYKFSLDLQDANMFEEKMAKESKNSKDQSPWFFGVMLSCEIQDADIAKFLTNVSHDAFFIFNYNEGTQLQCFYPREPSKRKPLLDDLKKKADLGCSVQTHIKRLEGPPLRLPITTLDYGAMVYSKIADHQMLVHGLPIIYGCTHLQLFDEENIAIGVCPALTDRFGGGKPGCGKCANDEMNETLKSSDGDYDKIVSSLHIQEYGIGDISYESSLGDRYMFLRKNTENPNHTTPETVPLKDGKVPKTYLELRNAIKQAISSVDQTSAEKKYISIRDLRLKGSICFYCNDPSGDDDVKHLICSGCMRAWYCNKSCQQNDWKYHSKWCAEQKVVKEMFMDID